MEKSKIKIFIVDDHAVVRGGTRDMLNRCPAFSVIGEAGCGEELPGIFRLSLPDILLLDIHLPGKSGLTLLPELKQQFPTVKIVLFSAHNELPYIRKAQTLKADGFLDKTITEPELQQALLQVFEKPRLEKSSMVVSAQIHEKLISQQQEEKATLLTAREEEVLRLLSKGLSNQAIAEELILSVKTVDTHIANIMKKTTTNKRTQLVAYAHEQGLL